MVDIIQIQPFLTYLTGAKKHGLLLSYTKITTSKALESGGMWQHDSEGDEMSFGLYF